MIEAILFMVALIASGLGSVAGYGGGVIIKPVLDALHIMPVSTISFLSGCTVLTMSAVSLLRSRGNGVVLRLRTTTPLALGAAAGGLLGKWMFELLRERADESMLGFIQAVLMLITTGFVFFYTIEKEKFPSYCLISISGCFLAGMLLGIVSTFLGIGGGPLNVSLLFFLFSMDAKEAAKNSIFIILLSQAASLLSALAQHNIPSFAPHHFILMAAGGVAGALLGSSIGKRMDNHAVEKILTGLILLIIVINIYNVICFGMDAVM